MGILPMNHGLEARATPPFPRASHAAASAQTLHATDPITKPRAAQPSTPATARAVEPPSLQAALASIPGTPPIDAAVARAGDGIFGAPRGLWIASAPAFDTSQFAQDAPAFFPGLLVLAPADADDPAGLGLPDAAASPGAEAALAPGFADLVPADSERESVPTPLPYLVVDTSAYVLTVYRNGAPVRRFPVGLGRDDATPVGLYRVVHKISRPDWYNRGEVVPAGDPRNPLGDRWLGLGEDPRPTGYGIHPTPDRASIGQPFSRGCIRMRPEDAETLFRLCPVGTPVRITP